MKPTSRRAFTNRHFAQHLVALRSKVELLPEEQRPEFRAALDEADQQHTGMQRKCATLRDVAGDIGLSVAYAKFHVEACRREAQEMRRDCHVNREH